MSKALALMYHDVVPVGRSASSGFQTVGAEHYKLTVQQFEEHLAAIERTVARKPVLIDEDDWHTSFLFTMDDGGSSSLHVADQLERRGWRGHFFIATNCIGTVGFMSSGELRKLSRRGHVIGSHSCSHPIPMWNCTPERIFSEWRDSRLKLEDVLDKAITCASVPGGAYTRMIAESAARAGYVNLFSSEPTRSVQYVDGCRVIGRYMILHTTPAAEAARLAGGDALTCARQHALWNGKKLLKKWASGPYAAARAYMMQRRYPKADADRSQAPKCVETCPPESLERQELAPRKGNE